MKRGVKPTVTADQWIDAILAEMQRTDSIDFSVASVAERLGITKGSFYNYFDSKERVVRAALERWLDDENSVLGQIEREAAGSIEAVVRRIFSTVRGYRYPLVYFLVGVSRTHGAYRELARTIQRSRFERVHALFLRRGLSSRDAARIGVGVLAPLIGASYLDSSGLFDLPNAPASREARWEAVVDLTIRGLRSALGELGLDSDDSVSR